VLALVVSTLLAAGAPRPFAEERLLLDRRLETLRRILPDGPNPAADVSLVRELATAARLSRLEIAARPPVETGARGDVVLDVSATGRFGDVDRFFRQATLSPRLLDVEALTLATSPDGLVRLTTVVRVPFRPARAPVVPAPEGLRARPAGVPRPVAEAFLRDQALALAKSEAIATLRRLRRNPRLFLSELSAIVRDRPVTLSFASLGDEFLVRGLSVGEGPTRALESRFERGFFRVSDFLMARQGACRRFEVRGRAPVAGIEAELPLPSEDPFDQDEAPCRVDRDDEGRTLFVKGGTANGKPAGKGQKATPPSGPLTVRLRDMDVADVFQVLHVLTGQAFIVDADVVGRAHVELLGVTLEEALAALRKAGLDIADRGPVRRVSSSRGKAQALAPMGGSPDATFSLKRADARELLAIMTDMDPGLAALGPQGSLGRFSLWARDLPLPDLRAALLSAVELTEAFEEGRRILHRKTGADDPVFPVAGSGDERHLVLRAQDLAVLEFEVAGVATAGDGYRAFAYSPTGVLNTYRAGDHLADGVVKSVESTDVTLETDDGPLPLAVAPYTR
jgi:hypothetical protein